MDNKVSDALRRAARRVTINHPWSVDAAVYRKIREQSDGDDADTLGGALLLGEDEEESRGHFTLLGAARVKFTGQAEPSDISGDAFAYDTRQELTAMIEPANESDGMVIQPRDLVYLIFPGVYAGYQVTAVRTAASLPFAGVPLYVLEPYESGAADDMPEVGA